MPAFAPPEAAPAGRAGRGGRGGRGASAARNTDLDPIGRIWSLIGMQRPVMSGRGGFGGFGGANGPTTANTGDYLVTMTVNGKTYKQVFRVERVSGGGEEGFSFGEDDTHDGLGRYTPKKD